MTDRGAALARLVHDVGKHGTRAARNVAPSGDVPRMIADMLADDLYGRGDRPRLSALFEELADSAVEAATLTRARALLTDIDALEDAVRRAEPDAVRRAASLALALDDLLREEARARAGEASA